MAHANFNVTLKAIIQRADGKILALKAYDNGPMAGYNDMPGGRIDDNEVSLDFADILKREIKEELGEINYTLKTNPVAAVSWTWPTGSLKGQEMVSIYFLGEYQSGEINISDEHLGHDWIEPTTEQIDKYFTSYHNKALKNYLSL
ncbi:MAG TPA: NUDIX domain-containing protein [Patescibacteria group bacterium]|jgi:8-oxo-dGTP pyrophosphatase MutT (NUDIX family)|nr:NUDIX domain-containing protein [Patescibacteria group bacterium]